MLYSISRKERVGYRVDDGLLRLWFTREVEARIKTYEPMPPAAQALRERVADLEAQNARLEEAVREKEQVIRQLELDDFH